MDEDELEAVDDDEGLLLVQGGPRPMKLQTTKLWRRMRGEAHTSYLGEGKPRPTGSPTASCAYVLIYWTESRLAR